MNITIKRKTLLLLTTMMTAGIIACHAQSWQSVALTRQRTEDTPTQPGLYIVNGKKVLLLTNNPTSFRK